MKRMLIKLNRSVFLTAFRVVATIVFLCGLPSTSMGESGPASVTDRFKRGLAAEQRVVHQHLVGKERKAALRDALEHYSYAINATTDSNLKLKALKRRAVMSFALNDCNSAVADTAEVLKHTSARDPEMHKIRGHCYSLSQEYAQAIREYGQSIRSGEKDLEVFRFRGRAYAALRQYKSAIADFSVYLERLPQMDVFEERGDAYEQLGNYAAARDDYESALAEANKRDEELYGNRPIESWPGPIHFKSKIGKTFLAEGNIFSARKTYESVVAQFPDSKEGYYGLAQTYLVEQDPQQLQKALEAASKAVSLSRGQDPYALAVLAESVFRTGDAESAVSIIERAVTLDLHQDAFRASLKKYINASDAHRKTK